MAAILSRPHCVETNSAKQGLVHCGLMAPSVDRVNIGSGNSL